MMEPSGGRNSIVDDICSGREPPLYRSKNSDRLFCIVRHWPADGLLHVPVTGQVRGARMLGGSGMPAIKTETNGFTLDPAGIQMDWGGINLPLARNRAK